MITHSVVELYGNKGTLHKNKKTGHHFIYLDDYNIQRRMKQSGFIVEQIEKDKYPESKNRLKIKSKITS